MKNRMNKRTCNDNSNEQTMTTRRKELRIICTENRMAKKIKKRKNCLSCVCICLPVILKCNFRFVFYFASSLVSREIVFFSFFIELLERDPFSLPPSRAIHSLIANGTGTVMSN